MPGDPLWSYIDMAVGISVLRQSDHFVRVPTPTHDELTASGVEGTDWFRGGYEYTVSDEIAADLVADGFAVVGFGFGPFGFGPLGGSV